MVPRVETKRVHIYYYYGIKSSETIIRMVFEGLIP